MKVSIRPFNDERDHFTPGNRTYEVESRELRFLRVGTELEISAEQTKRRGKGRHAPTIHSNLVLTLEKKDLEKILAEVTKMGLMPVRGAKAVKDAIELLKSAVTEMDQT